MDAHHLVILLTLTATVATLTLLWRRSVVESRVIHLLKARSPGLWDQMVKPWYATGTWLIISFSKQRRYNKARSEYRRWLSKGLPGVSDRETIDLARQSHSWRKAEIFAATCLIVLPILDYLVFLAAPYK